MPDVAISWYYPHYCIGALKIVPGDSHWPDGPRNDRNSPSSHPPAGGCDEGVVFILSLLLLLSVDRRLL